MNIEIPFYNFLNIFFVGIVTSVFAFMFQLDGLYLDTVKSFIFVNCNISTMPAVCAVWYFVGLVVDRIGSVVIEPLVKRLGLVAWVEYELYCKAEQNDKKIESITREYALSRNLLTMFLVLLFALLVCKNLNWQFYVICMAGSGLFGCSMRKHAGKIADRCKNKYKCTIVLTATDSEESAEALAEKILSEKLAACVQIQKVKSFYTWKSKIERSEECLLMIKTRSDLFDELAEFIKQNHDYQVPEILQIPIASGVSDYIQWTKEVTK
jgi:periplasmic divalent cation tolerance protein